MKSSTAVAASLSRSAHSASSVCPLSCRQFRGDAVDEFLLQHRDAFCTSLAVTDRHRHLDTIRAAAVLEEHLHRVTDVAQRGIEIVFCELLVFAHRHLVTQLVDARVAGNGVFVVGGGQAPEDHRHGDHVLDAVIAIRRVIERPCLVDDANAGLLRFDNDLVDVVDAILHLAGAASCRPRPRFANETRPGRKS